MENLIRKIKNIYFSLLGRDPEFDQEDLEGRITNSLVNLKTTISKFKKETEVIKGAFQIAEKSEKKGKKKLEDFFSLLNELAIELEEVKELVKINDKIKRYLFKPIQRTQRTAMWVAIVFGIVGALLKGPEFVDWVQAKFTQKAVAPSYYENERLKYIRSFMTPNLYSKASDRITDLVENTDNQKIKSQAEIYQAIIYLNNNEEIDDIDIWKEIQEIDESGDSFLEGKKLMLTAIYHLKNNNIEECDKFLRRVEIDEKYGDILKIETYYYQMISLLKSDNLTESERLNISNDLIARLQAKLNSISSEFVFVDMSNGERRVKDEIEKQLEKRVAEEEAMKNLLEEERARKLAEEEKIRKAEQEAQEREAKRKELYRQFKELRVGVFYNRFRLNGQVISNEQVKAKAKELSERLRKEFPEMEAISEAQPLEIKYVNQGIGYQKDNYFFNQENEASGLLFEEMKSKRIIKSWQLEYERLLRERYPQYDFVILLAK